MKLFWLTVCVALCTVPVRNVVAEDGLPAGELGIDKVQIDRVHYLRLNSGKLFRQPKRMNHPETSVDQGATWEVGGRIDPYMNIGFESPNIAMQMQSGPYKGRIIVPRYLEMDGAHPDYDRKIHRGGYAIWKGKVILLETHTHHPEMAGSYACYSDDEGKTWQVSAGFMMGYIQDGHLGHWSCEEPVMAELKDGRVLCFMRSTTGRILKSYSEDGGQHWMKVQPTDIAMSNSPCTLKRIPGTGDLLLVWNPMSADEIRKGYRRGRLSIAISKDDGVTWENVKTLERIPSLPELKWVTPPPLQPMVRGPSGPDDLMGEIPDDFLFYHYSDVFFEEDKFLVKYLVSPPAGPGARIKWRSFRVSWLYEP